MALVRFTPRYIQVHVRASLSVGMCGCIYTPPHTPLSLPLCGVCVCVSVCEFVSPSLSLCDVYLISFLIGTF